jgi:hypothetical protein
MLAIGAAARSRYFSCRRQRRRNGRRLRKWRCGQGQAIHLELFPLFRVLFITLIRTGEKSLEPDGLPPAESGYRGGSHTPGTERFKQYPNNCITYKLRKSSLEETETQSLVFRPLSDEKRQGNLQDANEMYRNISL